MLRTAQYRSQRDAPPLALHLDAQHLSEAENQKRGWTISTRAKSFFQLVYEAQIACLRLNPPILSATES